MILRFSTSSTYGNGGDRGLVSQISPHATPLLKHLRRVRLQIFYGSQVEYIFERKNGWMSNLSYKSLYGTWSNALHPLPITTSLFGWTWFH